MGWDIIHFGLKHDIPVHDIHATGVELSKRLKTNIKLVAWEEFKYDEKKHEISLKKRVKYSTIEIISNTAYKTETQVEILYFQQKELKSKLRDKIFTLKFDSKDTKIRFNDLMSDFEANIYPIYTLNNEEISYEIFKENVYLDINPEVRYFGWEKAFHEKETRREWLLNKRKEYIEPAKLFGCKKVLICSDQGPTEKISDHIYMSTEELLDYTNKYKYYYDYQSRDEEEKGIHVNLMDYINGDTHLQGEYFVSVVFDTVD